MEEQMAANWGRGGPHKAKLQNRMGSPGPKDEVRGGQTPPAALGKWFLDVQDWGRRVRRDIILLEAYLAELNAATGANLPIELYDDPGDPPPPPNGFY